jgi:MFS family permease
VTSKPYHPIFIFAVLSALYVFSQFFRVSNAVIAPNLIQDLKLNAETLGILGGAYFYSFALLQLPMGPLLDRIGPRIIVGSFAFIGAFGAFIFAFGNSFFAVLFGRILMGVGMSAVLMGSMKVFILHFSSVKFATLSGAFMSAGTLGSLLAASPLAYFTSAIGWRTMFLLAGGITALLALLALRVLREEKGKEEPSAISVLSQTEIGILQSVRLILKSFSFWQIGILTFTRYGTFVSLQGLWLGPFLMDIEGYTPVHTGNMLVLIAIGTIIGSPISGWLSDQIFHSRKGVILGGLSLYCVSLFPLTGIMKIENPLWFGIIFFFIGFFASFGLLVYSHMKELFPVSISGTAMTFVNFFTMMGGAIFMPALGKVIESFPRAGNSYPSEAYHLSFLICFLATTASLVFYAFSKRETR